MTLVPWENTYVHNSKWHCAIKGRDQELNNGVPNKPRRAAQKGSVEEKHPSVRGGDTLPAKFNLPSWLDPYTSPSYTMRVIHSSETSSTWWRPGDAYLAAFADLKDAWGKDTKKWIWQQTLARGRNRSHLNTKASSWILLVLGPPERCHSRGE